MTNTEFTLRHLAAGIAISVSLTSCGGGGSAGDPTSTSAAATSATSQSARQTATTSQNAVSIAADPLTSVAQSAVDALNALRAQIGLGDLHVNDTLTNAAANHSRYTILNNEPGHSEVADSSGFTGTDIQHRLVAAGYDYRVAAEVFSHSSDADGAMAVDSLISAIYHRFAMLRSDMAEIGAGAYKLSGTPEVPMVDVTLNLGSRSSNQPSAPAAGAAFRFPYPEQTGVPIDFVSDAEAPDPVPSLNVVGYPISIQVDPRTTLSVTSFTIAPVSGGPALPTRLLTAATDTHTPAYAAAIIPLSPLLPATKYFVTVTGTIGGAAFNDAWVFTTASVAPLSVSADKSSIATGESATFTISGGVGSALDRTLFTGASSASAAPVTVRLLGSNRFQYVANGACPGTCEITAQVSDRRGSAVEARITVTR